MMWQDTLKFFLAEAKKGETKPPTEFHVDDKFEDTRLYFETAPISREDMDHFLQAFKELLK